MPFPFSLTGQVAVPEISDEHRALNHLEWALRVGRAKRVHCMDSRIRFGSGFYGRVGRFNLRQIVAPGAGEIAVRPSEGHGVTVRYTIHLTTPGLFSAALVSVLFAPFLFYDPQLTRGEATLIAAAAWLFLFGGNILSTYCLYPRWVRRTLSSSEFDE